MAACLAQRVTHKLAKLSRAVPGLASTPFGGHLRLLGLVECSIFIEGTVGEEIREILECPHVNLFVDEGNVKRSATLVGLAEPLSVGLIVICNAVHNSPDSVVCWVRPVLDTVIGIVMEGKNSSAPAPSRTWANFIWCLSSACIFSSRAVCIFVSVSSSAGCINCLCTTREKPEFMRRG